MGHESGNKVYIKNGYSKDRKPLSVELQSKLKQLILLLEKLTPIGQSIIKDIPVDVFNEPMFVKVNLFHRYVNRLEVLIPLLKQWEKNINLEDSIGILIRASLNDVISQFYIEHVHSKVKVCPSIEEENYIKVVRSLLADHLFSGINFHKNLRDASFYTEPEYIVQINNWKKLYPQYFKKEPIDYNKPTKNISSDKFPSPIEILKIIKNSDWLKKQKPELLYVSYFYYSKYEHFGVTTNSLQTSDSEVSLYFLIDSLAYIIFACVLCSIHFEYANNNSDLPRNNQFKVNKENIQNIYNEFVNIINENRPNYI